MYRVTRILKETFTGVRADMRASLLKIVMLTVTLTTVTCGVLIGAQGNHMKDYWKGRTDVNVYLCVQTSMESRCNGVASKADVKAIGILLDSSPMVKGTVFENREAAWDRFTRRYNTVNLINSVSILSIPESYRVKLADGHTPQDVANLLVNTGGVDTITSQEEALKPFTKMLETLQKGVLLFAGIQILGAMLLLGQTTRAAVRHRKSELEIMRLVGAGKWRVRAPFVLEHVLELTVGTALAYGALYLAQGGLYAPYIKPADTGVKLVDMQDAAMALLGVAGISLAAVLLFSVMALRKVTR